MDINSFLLARLVDNEAAVGPADLTAIQVVGLGSARAQIKRHHDRSMNVISRAGSETWTRCDVCAEQPEYPCNALKLMASTYESHPDFDQQWHLLPPTAA